jgi:hypothetical protein
MEERMAQQVSQWSLSGLTEAAVVERDYDGASPVVREAAATVREHAERKVARVLQWLAVLFGPLALYLVGGYLSWITVAPSTHEVLGSVGFMLMMLAWAVGPLLLHRSWGRELTNAREVLGQFERLEQLGVHVPAAVATGASSTDAMLARIRVLAADDPRTIASAEATAAHIRRVEEELAHLTELADEPDLSLALTSARQALTADHEHARADLASLYGALAERSAAADRPVLAIDDIVQQAEAASEVDQAVLAARKRALAQRG